MIEGLLPEPEKAIARMEREKRFFEREAKALFFKAQELSQRLLKQEIERSEMLEMLEESFCIIANSYGGNWLLAENPDWKPAAERYRDNYLKVIQNQKPKTERKNE